MTEQQMPARIWVGRQTGWAAFEMRGDTPYVRADIAERMAVALEILLDEADGFSVSGVYFNEPCMGHKGPDLARSALSAFRSATQDTEARHE